MDAASIACISPESGADIPRYQASLTKLMTLDLAFQALRDGKLTMGTQLPVSEEAAAVEPVKLGLKPWRHHRRTRRNPGDDDDVRQRRRHRARRVSGRRLRGRVAEMMTLRAHALGKAQTHFANHT